jgi:competence protein ComFC
MKTVKKILNKILNIIFPIRCVGCGIENNLLCDKCVSLLPVAKKTELEYTTSVFDYKNETLRKTIWSLKYHGNKDAGKFFAKSIYNILLEDISEQKIFSNFKHPLLIPIPLSKKRLKERGFNQSEIIAKEMSFLDNGTSFTLVTNVLYKIKDTPSQVSIKDKNKRLNNLQDCFIVKDNGLINGKNIILIDDITTTGATIKEARKTLRAAGAKKVIAFTAAH